MTISVSVTPAVSFGPGSNGPASGAAVVAGAVVAGARGRRRSPGASDPGGAGELVGRGRRGRRGRRRRGGRRDGRQRHGAVGVTAGDPRLLPARRRHDDTEGEQQRDGTTAHSVLLLRCAPGEVLGHPAAGRGRGRWVAVGTDDACRDVGEHQHDRDQQPHRPRPPAGEVSLGSDGRDHPLDHPAAPISCARQPASAGMVVRASHRPGRSGSGSPASGQTGAMANDVERRAEDGAFDDDAVPFRPIDDADPPQITDAGSGPATDRTPPRRRRGRRRRRRAVVVAAPGERHRRSSSAIALIGGMLGWLIRDASADERGNAADVGFLHDMRAHHEQAVQMAYIFLGLRRHRARAAHGRPQHPRRAEHRDRPDDPDAARHGPAGGRRDRRGDGLDGHADDAGADAGHGHRRPARAARRVERARRPTSCSSS